MYTPITGTLGFVLSRDREHVLLVHRNARESDQHFGKYNGLGGKLEPGETVTECMRREIREESGLEVTSMRLRGTISWPGFGAGGEDWLGFIFLVDDYCGEPSLNNPEGQLGWFAIADLSNLPMWEGDRHWLPLVFSDEPRVFHGVMPYVAGRPASWRYDWC